MLWSLGFLWFCGVGGFPLLLVLYYEVFSNAVTLFPLMMLATSLFVASWNVVPADDRA